MLLSHTKTKTTVRPALKWMQLLLILIVLQFFKIDLIGQDGKTLYEIYCKGNEGKVVNDYNVRKISQRGIKSERFFEQFYHDDICLSKLQVDNLAEWRNKKLMEFIQRHLNINNLNHDNSNGNKWYRNTNLSPLLSDENELYKNLVKRTGDISRFITLYEEEAYFDCNASTYNYRVVILTPKNPLMVFPEEIQSLIKKEIDSLFNEKIIQLKHQSHITIDIYNDIFIRLINNHEFIKRVKKIFLNSEAVSEDILEYFDPPTKSFFENIFGMEAQISPFGSGEYILSGDVSFLIEVFTKRFLRNIEYGRQYKIVSKGFADSRTIISNINYFDGANLALPKNNEEEIETASKNFKIIDNNIKLSIARGYSGADIINKILDEELVGEQRKNVKIFYSGGGAIPGPPHATYRRIDLIISY